MMPPIRIAVVSPTEDRFRFFCRELASTGRCVFVRVTRADDVLGHIFDTVIALQGADWDLVDAARQRLQP